MLSGARVLLLLRRRFGLLVQARVLERVVGSFRRRVGLGRGRRRCRLLQLLVDQLGHGAEQGLWKNDSRLLTFGNSSLINYSEKRTIN